eukprot:458336_1
MASSYLITLLLLQFVYVLKSQNNATRATPAPSSTSTTGYFTSEPSAIACSANYGFVYIESSSLTLSETLLSERTNYPPYAYSTAIIQSRVSLYANNERVSETVNNPCDTTTWTTPSSHYDNTIVLIPYTQTYDMLCTPQQWSLNLQQYGNTKAVLIANDKELPVVYTLSGDTSLPHPIIPTRMISKNSATKIIHAITSTSQTVFATIDCLNDTLHPSIICMLDSSVMPRPENVILDGEYQEQANILVNDHPVWLKEGHTGPIPMWSHSELFMWLTINHSTTNNPWRWVIGSDYNNENTITMECITNSTSYMDDPTLCGSNWYRNGIVQSNMSSHGGICDAGDVYVCVETPQTYFKTYFAGRYRQLHPNVHYYISQTAQMATVLTILYNFLGYGYYWWAFEAGYGPEATCLITSQEMVSAPWMCNSFWSVWNPVTRKYDETNHFDVDECSHPNLTINATIIYPKRLCLRDPIHSDTTFYQSYHGVYILDDTQQFDERFVYRNQRLSSSQQYDLYMIFVDEYDSWVINDHVPPANVAIPNTIQGYCNDNVFTPDQCSNCWVFGRAFLDELRCNTNVFVINDTVTERECIARDIPMNTIINYTPQMTVCFDDGVTDIYNHTLSGTYILQPDTLYNERALWSMREMYYIYYSERWKYWVIDTELKEPLTPSWRMICLLWDSYQPWDCVQWYTPMAFNITMIAPCDRLRPTHFDTTSSSDERIGETKDNEFTGWVVGCLIFLCLLGIIAYCVRHMCHRKRRESRTAFRKEDGAHVPAFQSNPTDDGAQMGGGEALKENDNDSLKEGDGDVCVTKHIEKKEKKKMKAHGKKEQKIEMLNWQKFDNDEDGGEKVDPFDDDDGAGMITVPVGTIGEDLAENPFLGKTNQDPEIDDSEMQREKWLAFDE